MQEVPGILLQRIETLIPLPVPVQFEDDIPRSPHERGRVENHRPHRMDLREPENLRGRIVNLSSAVRIDGHSTVGGHHRRPFVKDSYDGCHKISQG